MEPTDTTRVKQTRKSESKIGAMPANKPSDSHATASPARPNRTGLSRRVQDSADTIDPSASNSSNLIEGGRKELFPPDPPGQTQPNE